jgi:hypothetical protein
MVILAGGGRRGHAGRWGPHARERGSEGNGSRERLAGPRAVSVAGLVWSPTAFSFLF